MDWSKAKNVLILLFLALNIFLGANLVITYYNDKISDTKEDSLKKAAIAEGYKLDCSIPSVEEVEKLQYEAVFLDKESLVFKLLGNKTVYDGSNRIEAGAKKLVFSSDNTFTYKDSSPSEAWDILNKGKAEKKARDFLGALGIPDFNLDRYYLDRFKRNSDGTAVMEFIYKYEGYYIYDNSVELIVSGKGIRAMNFGLVRVIGFEPLNYTPTPPHEILFNSILFNDSLKNMKGTINKIDLGFKCLQKGKYADSGVEPVWRIAIDGKGALYFNVKDGSLIE